MNNQTQRKDLPIEKSVGSSRWTNYRRRSFFVIQTSVLLAVISWLWIDPLGEGVVAVCFDAIGSPAEFYQRLAPHQRLSGVALVAIFGGSAIWILFEFVHFLPWWGQRISLKRLFGLTAVTAMWLTIGFGYQSIAWQGKRMRSIGRVGALKELAVELTQNWPGDAGEMEGLGPFTAYPIGDPKLLLLLTSTPLPATDTVIVAVERSEQGSLRFELGGKEYGDWIEWHPDGKRPDNFCGGLTNDYQLRKYTQLSEQWYLVRYRGDEMG